MLASLQPWRNRPVPLRHRTPAPCCFRRGTVSVLILLAFVFPAQGAQSETILGTSVNVATGGTSRGISQNQNSSLQLPGNTLSETFYGIYPGISLTTMWRSSSFKANYLYGLTRRARTAISQTGQGSHTADFQLSSTLSSRWDVALSDSFTVTDDLSTFNALNGVSSVQGVNSLFSPVATLQSLHTNRINADFTWALDQDSGVTFSAAHSIRRYATVSLLTGPLSNQQEFSGGMTFHQNLGAGKAWGLSYYGSYYDHKNSIDAISHSAQASYSMQIARDTTMYVSAGVSQVNNQGAAGGYLGYDAIAQVEKTLQAGKFALSYTQDSRESIELGSSSSSRHATLDWNRTFGKFSTSAALGGFDSKGTLNNFQRLRGVKAMGDVAYPVSRTLSVAGGITYQSNRRSAVFDFNQSRVFISLRYSEPNLKRFR